MAKEELELVTSCFGLKLCLEEGSEMLVSSLSLCFGQDRVSCAAETNELGLSGFA